jgi:hypothetical protein
MTLSKSINPCSVTNTCSTRTMRKAAWTPNIAGLMLLSLALVMQLNAFSQQSEFSPYSRFGFGLINQMNTPVATGLAGMETAMANAYQFNPGNPASATFLTQTTLQGSGMMSNLSMRQGDDNEAGATFGSAGPMGIVVKRKNGKNALILGASSYSNSGYAITRNNDIEGIGVVQERYNGEGGLSNANVGWARVFRSSRMVAAGDSDSIRVSNRSLHMGIQTQYLFGQVRRSSTMDIIDPTFLDHRANFTAQHRSISTDIGLILDQLIRVRYNKNRDFENSLALRIGGVFTPEAKLSSDISRLDETTQTLGGIAVNLDTTYFSSLTAFAGRMPRSSNAGISLHYDRADGMRWSAGIEYSTTAWSEVADEMSEELLSDGVNWDNAEALRLGFQFNLGRSEQRHPTWGKASYRFGLATGNQPFSIEEAPIAYQTASAGATIPLVGSRSLSRIHFGMEFGTRSAENSNYEERIYRFNLGVSLMPFFKNNWLVPRLYD